MHTYQQQDGLYWKDLIAFLVGSAAGLESDRQRQAAALQTHEIDGFGGHHHRVDFKDAFVAPG